MLCSVGSARPGVVQACRKGWGGSRDCGVEQESRTNECDGETILRAPEHLTRPPARPEKRGHPTSGPALPSAPRCGGSATRGPLGRLAGFGHASEASGWPDSRDRACRKQRGTRAARVNPRHPPRRQRTSAQGCAWSSIISAGRIQLDRTALFLTNVSRQGLEASHFVTAALKPVTFLATVTR